MKKIARISMLLLSLAFVTLATVATVRPVQAYVNEPIWIPPYAFKGYENTYYYNYIVAYENGSTVAIKIPVYGSYSNYVNVTYVSMKFDWGLNLTSNYNSNPVRIDQYTTHYFDLSFTANANDATWVWAHDWIIDVEFTDQYGFNSSWTDTPGYRFVVYSQDQVQTKDLYSQYNALVNNFYPNTVEASLLKVQANAEANVANNFMQQGRFNDSATHYQQAISLIQQAIDKEGTRGAAIEDAELNATITDASANMKQADAAMLQAQAIMNQGYGYILFGLGWILIGIGVIAYGMKKPKQ